MLRIVFDSTESRSGRRFSNQRSAAKVPKDTGTLNHFNNFSVFIFSPLFVFMLLSYPKAIARLWKILKQLRGFGKEIENETR
jgi:hypothetical protein